MYWISKILNWNYQQHNPATFTGEITCCNAYRFYHKIFALNVRATYTTTHVCGRQPATTTVNNT